MWSEVKYAARSLTRRPGVSGVVLLTLALAIGINTTIFSALNAVLLRPLGYPASDRLIVLFERNDAAGLEQEPVSTADYVDWRDRTRSFDGLGAWRYRGTTLTGRGDPIHVPSVDVSPALLQLLRVPPFLGRLYTASDETRGEERLAILSHASWSSRFGADPGIVGSTIQLDGQAHTVVGVMPPGFVFPAGTPDVEIWTPLTISAEAARERSHRLYSVLGRLADGVTLAQARQEMVGIAADIARQEPTTNAGWSVTLVPALEQLAGSTRLLLWFLFGAVLLVLAIGCVNVANILLAESTRSVRDYAVRAAIGAGRGALLRHSLAESLCLSLVGGAAALGVAAVGIRLLRAVMPGNLPRLADADLDGTVLGFTIVTSILCGLAFGLVPAVRAASTDVVSVLRDGSGAAGGGPRSRWLNDLLVAAEVALAVVLLVGAGLLVRSLVRLTSVDPGFRTSGVVSVTVTLPRARYPEFAQQRTFFLSLMERVQRLPGLTAAGAVSALPMNPVGVQFEIPFTVDGLEVASPSERPRADYRAAMPGYFEAMRIPLLRGRLLDEIDVRESRQVALINETMRRRVFPDVDPVGRWLRAVPMLGDLEVVGVVGDVKHAGPQAEARPELFAPFSRLPLSTMHIVAAGTLPTPAIVDAVRAEVLALDPQLPLTAVSTVESLLADSVAQPRFNTALLVGLALTAIALAAIGIYGVVSYVVARRTGEMGLRLVLGADPGDLTRLVLGQVARVLAAGIVVGVIAAALLGRAAASMFFGVSPTDPVTYALVAIAVLAIGLLAAGRPARYASRVDPATALRA